MKKWRAALVGCGLFGESHAAALQGIPDVELAAVFDTDQGKARALASRFNVPAIVSNLDDLWCEGIDTVHVVTTESAHKEPVVAALRAGKNVLVEKPFATSLDDCRAMMEAAQDSRGILLVGHLLRFDLRYGYLREQALSGEFGRIVSVSARRNRTRGGFAIYQRTHPGICNSIHDIDLMLSIVGSRVIRVRGFERRVYYGQNPDFFLGVLEFENGAVGEVKTCWLLPDAAGVALDDFMQVIGERGAGSVTLQPPALSFWNETGNISPDYGYETRLFGSAQGALLNEISYFYRCVRSGSQPEIITSAEATNAVRTALALLESASFGRDVELEEWT
ncbi:MAG: Gfo/Idh/MocA family oxidoreductase [Blastocatellia bacterium]|nr:Gfo/Idh/MocA family oxidoreductase [Blastocatellia bacterium]